MNVISDNNKTFNDSFKNCFRVEISNEAQNNVALYSLFRKNNTKKQFKIIFLLFSISKWLQNILMRV